MFLGQLLLLGFRYIFSKGITCTYFMARRRCLTLRSAVARLLLTPCEAWSVIGLIIFPIFGFAHQSCEPDRIHCEWMDLKAIILSRAFLYRDARQAVHFGR